MNEHQRFREWLAYRSELSPKQERQLEEHLVSCVECRRIAEDYARQLQLLRALPVLTPPRTARLGALHQAHQVPSTPRWPFRGPARGALAVGVGTLVVLVAAGLLHRPQASSRSAMQHRPTIITSTPVGNGPVSPSPKPSGKSAVTARPGAHPPLQSASGQNVSPPPVPSPSQAQAPVPASGQPYTIPPSSGSASVLGQVLPTTATLLPAANTAGPDHRILVPPSHPTSPSFHRPGPVSKNPVLTSAPPSPAPPTGVPLFSVQPVAPTPSPTPMSFPSPTPLASPVPQQTASPPVVRRTIAASLRPTPVVPVGTAAQAATTPTASAVTGPPAPAVLSPTKTLPSASITAPIASPSPSKTPTP